MTLESFEARDDCQCLTHDQSLVCAGGSNQYNNYVITGEVDTIYIQKWCIYVCVYVCVYMCMCVCTCVRVYVCMCVYVYVCTCVCVLCALCVYVCMCVCVYECMYVWYVCIFTMCIYIYMYLGYGPETARLRASDDCQTKTMSERLDARRALSQVAENRGVAPNAVPAGKINNKRL